MAVAVKSSQGASAGSQASPAILSVVGVIYLLACLAVVFEFLPRLWWGLWNQSGLEKSPFLGGTLLAIVGIAVIVGLLYLGSKLLGPNPPAGIRAGVFVGLTGLVTILLLARWASLWLEYWSFQGIFPESTGIALTIGVAAALLLLGLWLFFRPQVQSWILQLEQMGWFHATTYKSNQGQKVRRGTILGLLLIVGAGIYTLLSHNTLANGPRDLALNIPFTGKVALEGYGDMQPFLIEVPESDKANVKILWGGLTWNDTTNKFGPGEFTAGEVVSFTAYKAAVDSLIRSEPTLNKYLPLVEINEPIRYVTEVNKQILGDRLSELLSENYYTPGVKSALQQVFNETPWATIGTAVNEFYRQAQAVMTVDPKRTPGKAFCVPSAVVLIDRNALLKVNQNAESSRYVKVELKGSSDLPEGVPIKREEFDEVESKLTREKREGRDRDLPTFRELVPAYGPVQYSQITLLPSVQFTVPLLLLAGSIWLAWRLVNMPTFADFLIATEAELNKVSWASQRKLVQDTIVVLITVALMSIFLFGTDWMWKTVLSFKPIGVLHIPTESSQQHQPVDLKKY